MFIGEYSYSVDTKGRIAIPAKFRASLVSGCVVTRGIDDCLFLYAKEEWERLAKRLAKLPISQSNSRAFSRLMLAGAMDLEIDRQGRVVLPKYLRQYAKLEDKAIIAGLYNRLEIWNSDRWNRYKKQAESSSVDIAEQLGELEV
jgi:MraZ protein